MEWFDKNKTLIQDNETILFTHEDSVEPSGYNKYSTKVKLCYWSEIERRYIPFEELQNYINPGDSVNVIKDCERINLKRK